MFGVSVWGNNVFQSKSCRHKLRPSPFQNIKIKLCLFYSERIRDLPVDVRCSIVESVGKQLTASKLRKSELLTSS